MAHSPFDLYIIYVLLSSDRVCVCTYIHSKQNRSHTMPVPVSAAVGAVCALLLLASSTVLAQHHQQIEPSYLQQYYAQVAQAAGAQADATPIVEQTPAADAQQQYYVSPQAQQIRVKDAVAQQVSNSSSCRLSSGRGGGTTARQSM